MKKYDFINPEHYKKNPKEVYEIMKFIWGEDNFKIYCQMNAFKYRMRIGNKPDQNIEQEYEKIKWYENKSK